MYHECEGRIEKSVPWNYRHHKARNLSLLITVCHHKASQVMINRDPEGQVFLYTLRFDITC